MSVLITTRRGRNVLYQGTSLQDATWSLFGPDIRFFSVCSGIEAASVAWTPLGWRPVGFAEIEPFPSAVLRHHYPRVLNHGDFTKVCTSRLGRVDVLCGGTPCQAFSIAGNRASLDDARGNLTLAFVGLAHELVDGNGLRNVVWENVPGVLSTKDNAFGCFLAGLVGAATAFIPTEPAPLPGRASRQWGWSAKHKSHYIKWPRSGVVIGPKGRAAWTVKDAQYFQLAQRRERVIVVADFGNGADPAAVLFEPEGVRRDSPPSREAGQRVTGTIASRTTGGGGLGTYFDLDGGLLPVLSRPLLAKGNDSFDDTLQTYIPQLARCVATREGSSQDYESTTMLAVTSVTGPISHALKAEGADGSEDGTGRGTPIIAFDCKASGQSGFGVGEIASTMRAMGHSNSHQNGGGHLAVAMTVALRGREGGGTAELGDDCAFALRASSGGGDKPHVLTSAVRRLTPRECERLQGFQFRVHASYPGAWQDHSGRWWSPDYTAIPWRRKLALACPDGPRYKSLGNSWAVPKFRWLATRIAAFMPPRVALPAN
jgi:DNA (cytosine-5)-methyltransferase 1